jgi:hypothetical protein
MEHAQKKRKSAVYKLVAVFGLIALFIGWYATAANYDYRAIAGLYVLNQNGETCILDLRSDRTFTEELTRSGKVQRAHGTWHRYGESHVSFSSEFLTVSGEELNASGESHGEFAKRLGIFSILTLAPLPDGPKFRKRLLH